MKRGAKCCGLFVCVICFKNCVCFFKQANVDINVMTDVGRDLHGVGGG